MFKDLINSIPFEYKAIKVFTFITQKGMSYASIFVKTEEEWKHLGQLVDEGIITFVQRLDLEKIAVANLTKDDSCIKVVILENEEISVKECKTLKEVFDLEKAF